jgi:futalosine hydrolase
MKILITAATPQELSVAQQLAPVFAPADLVCAVTGIGIAATVYHTLTQLHGEKYDLAVNIGIAGSFTPRLPVGSVCRITKEYFGDCGIQTPEGFRTLFEEHLMNDNTFPFVDGALHAPTQLPLNIDAAIPTAVGVTVNTVSGAQPRIDELQAHFPAEVETMESAAFFYVCLQEKIPFLALRAISNKVEPRDRSKWNIPLALDNLGKALRQMNN